MRRIVAVLILTAATALTGLTAAHVATAHASAAGSTGVSCCKPD